MGALALAQPLVTSVSWTIGPDLPAHAESVERVLDAAFGPGRFAKTGERVRELTVLDRALSRLAFEGDRVVGCCRIYRVGVGAADAVFLGPLAVHPDMQGAGVGHDLVRVALAACDAERLPVILIGQPSFFGSFGFEEVPDGAISLPAPVERRRLMWRLADPRAPLAGAITGPRAAS